LGEKVHSAMRQVTGTSVIPVSSFYPLKLIQNPQVSICGRISICVLCVYSRHTVLTFLKIFSIFQNFRGGPLDGSCSYLVIFLITVYWYNKSSSSSHCLPAKVPASMSFDAWRQKEGLAGWGRARAPLRRSIACGCVRA